MKPIFDNRDDFFHNTKDTKQNNVDKFWHSIRFEVIKDYLFRTFPGPEEDCYVRSHLICIGLCLSGIQSGKVWVRFAATNHWRFHVASIFKMEGRIWVIDLDYYSEIPMFTRLPYRDWKSTQDGVEKKVFTKHYATSDTGSCFCEGHITDCCKCSNMLCFEMLQLTDCKLLKGLCRCTW